MIEKMLQNTYSIVCNISNEWKIAIFTAIFTSLISILGIYFTIKHNEKMINLQLQAQKEEYDENKRLQIMPYIKYTLRKTEETSHLGYDNGGFNFFPFGFVTDANGQTATKFYQKMRITNKLLSFKNVSKNPCVYFKVIEVRTDGDADIERLVFPFEISVIEDNGETDMFIQTGLPRELPESSKYKNFNDIPQNYSFYLDICYGDILGNYYEQSIKFRVIPIPIIYQDGSPSNFNIDMNIDAVTLPKYVPDKNILKDKPKSLDVKFMVT